MKRNEENKPMGERAIRMLWELRELTELMAWLSTLGGAFSALGDYQHACADTAGKISIHQMKLAFRLGDPSLVARCQLYLAISLTQKTEFAAAKRIIQKVYRSETKQTDPDTRLLKMCQGIWAKLRYEYELHQRQQARKKI
ncbi:AGAP001342-PA-like protein [Anopheles sinensis]|uniref:AGAP001342-PA-like protein n=1 Tax=Anopheles sinensis TaxID=74873 RepID=A0A084VS70_ANOSI|nr:AGAP001342-PA-like protein [Anopheles sinensis]